MLNPFRAVFLKWRYIDMYDFSKKKNKTRFIIVP